MEEKNKNQLTENHRQILSIIPAEPGMLAVYGKRLSDGSIEATGIEPVVCLALFRHGERTGKDFEFCYGDPEVGPMALDPDGAINLCADAGNFLGISGPGKPARPGKFPTRTGLGLVILTAETSDGAAGDPS